MRLSSLGLVVTALAASLVVGGCVIPEGALTSRSTHTETRDLDPQGRFVLDNTNGNVTVTTWDEPRVRIEAEKAASSAAVLRNLQVEVSGQGDRVEVRTRHRKGGSFLFGAGRVTYRITVPRGARVKVENVNGGVQVDGLSGDLEASTVNGGIDITGAAGAVEASSVNGGIRAAYGAWSQSSRHRFKTVNGAITVQAPEGLTGRLEVRTVNGSIDNALSLEGGTSSRRRLEGRMGPGGGSLDVETTNGSIRLVRG